MHGDIGQPYGGFPQALQRKVLKRRVPLTSRPGDALPPLDLTVERSVAQKLAGRDVTDAELASYLMYPKVFVEYAKDRMRFGNVSALPTGAFFYGMQVGDEITVDLERGKSLIIRFIAASEVAEDGLRTVFFELNGQPRSVRVPDRSHVATRPPTRKADIADAKQIGAPMPGHVITVNAVEGQKVARGETLLTIEAMKMETAVRADQDSIVSSVLVIPGQQVDAKDLLMIMK